MNNSDIIKALAKGINPITGELISNDDLLSDPTIIRALYSAVESMKSGNIDHSSSNNLTSTSTSREDNNIKKGLPKNHRKPWDLNSIDELVYKFKNGSTAGVDRCCLYRSSKEPAQDTDSKKWTKQQH